MDANAITLTASCAAALGIGAGLTIKLVPAFLAARRDRSTLRYVPNGLEDASSNDEAYFSTERTPGRIRNSSIVGLYRDALRHADGSFTRAFHVELSPSVFSDDLAVENRCDALARMLAARKPVGTSIQFRLSAGVDPGHALFRHDDARDIAGTHRAALMLHDGGIQHYAAMAALGLFRQTVLTCWVRVPNPHRRAEDQFLPTLKREINRGGLTRLPFALARSWQAASSEQIIRRIVSEEQEAFEEAEKTFRLIERECPLTLTPFTRDELWAAVFLGHRQNAASVPALSNDGTDLRDYLCGETIEANGHYVMHGACPAALISLFTPPQPTITADALRLLSVNGSLNFRHTIISEFVYPDQRQGIKHLDRRIGQVGRSANSLTGKYKLSPEARVALEDLAHLRHDLAGGRAALAQVRLSVVVYGHPARTRAELAASLKELDRNCEQVISEIRKISGADADRGKAIDVEIFCDLHGLKACRFANVFLYPVDFVVRKREQPLEFAQDPFLILDAIGNQVDPKRCPVERNRLSMSIDNPATPRWSQGQADPIAFRQQAVLFILRNRQPGHASCEQTTNTESAGIYIDRGGKVILNAATSGL